MSGRPTLLALAVATLATATAACSSSTSPEPSVLLDVSHTEDGMAARQGLPHEASWSPPVRRFHSANGEWLVKIKQRGLLPARATVFHRQADGRHAWASTIRLDSGLETHAFKAIVSDDGRYVAVLDDAIGSEPVRPDVAVFRDGERIYAFRLDQVLSRRDIFSGGLDFARPWWCGGEALDIRAQVMLLSLSTDSRTRCCTVAFDLASGRSPGPERDVLPHVTGELTAGLPGSPAPPAVEGKPGTAADVRPVSAEELLAHAIDRPMPVYPEIAERARIYPLTVGVDVTVGPDGTVERVVAWPGPMGVENAVVEAVKRWRFKPFGEADAVVRARGRFAIRFDLVAEPGGLCAGR